MKCMQDVVLRRLAVEYRRHEQLVALTADVTVSSRAHATVQLAVFLYERRFILKTRK